MMYSMCGVLLTVVVLGSAILGQCKVEKDDVARGGKAFTVDITTINQTFNEIFLMPRNDRTDQALKEKAKNAIIQRHRKYGLEIALHYFKHGKDLKGVNIIGILPGKNRNRILLIGGHYDTVQKTAGVADNGSGSVLVLEAARLLSQHKGQLDHTILFVHFDLEEYGLLGSRAFVRDYLIDQLILEENRIFLGAIIADMVLNYDPTPGSQSIPKAAAQEIPGAMKDIEKNNNTGDFLAVVYRKDSDRLLADTISHTWRFSFSMTFPQKFRLVKFDLSLPKYAASRYDVRSTFTRSDHASFWYHGHPKFNQTLPAVELSDRGMWRGTKGANCYHRPCDDAGWLTKDNLQFLNDALTIVIEVGKKGLLQSKKKAISN